MIATASGTPLVISVLALGVSLAAVLVARANLQRQLQVAAREAWMREFREQVAQFLTSVMRGLERRLARRLRRRKSVVRRFHFS
jgi:hypothetical protein